MSGPHNYIGIGMPSGRAGARRELEVALAQLEDALLNLGSDDA